MQYKNPTQTYITHTTTQNKKGNKIWYTNLRKRYINPTECFLLSKFVNLFHDRALLLTPWKHPLKKILTLTQRTHKREKMEREKKSTISSKGKGKTGREAHTHTHTTCWRRESQILTRGKIHLGRDGESGRRNISEGTATLRRLKGLQPIRRPDGKFSGGGLPCAARMCSPDGQRPDAVTSRGKCCWWRIRDNPR